MTRIVTLLDLMNAVAEHAQSEAEVVATVVYLVNSGRVRLRGSLEGGRFELAGETRAVA
jgi:hypothetical protein